MFLQTTVFQGLLGSVICISQFQVHPCTPWATARHLIVRLVSPQILHGLEVRHLPIPGPPPSFCHKHAFLSKQTEHVCSTPKLGKRQSPGNKLPLHDSFLRGFYLSKSHCFCFFYLKRAVPAGSLYTAIINDSNY